MSLPPKQQQALEAVLDRATVDQAFRDQLLANPRRAIMEGFGIGIPSTFNVKFIEKDRGVDALIVLPDVRRPEGELSEDDLESVSGGAHVDPGWNW